MDPVRFKSAFLELTDLFAIQFLGFLDVGKK